MKFAIIAAGDGSRLRSEGISEPKPLLRVGGATMIERLLRLFSAAHPSEIVCIVNEQGQAVVQFVESLALQPRPRILIRSTPSSLHSLVALADWLGAEPFVLATTDSVFRESEWWTFLRHCEGREGVDGVLAVTDYIHDERPLCVELDERDRIRSFRDDAQGLTYATGGIYYFRPPLLDDMREAVACGVERLRNALRHVLAKGRVLEVFRFSRIVDVDHVNDIPAAEALVAAVDTVT